MPRSEAPHRVTLQDIADRTGVTVNTVSRALKNKSDISAATKERIQQIAAEMGYIRNRAASSLRSGRTKTLGVIVGGMSNPYYSIMTDAIQNVATEKGYSLLIFCSRDDADLELHLVESAISHQVDGILLFPCNTPDRSIALMKASGVPYVLMARHLGNSNDDWVISDDEAGGYLAAKHLIDAGHTRLAYLSGFSVAYASDMRIQGFYRAITESGLPRENGLTACCASIEETRRQLETWRQIGVTGLFLFCDAEAWRTVSLLQAQRCTIPQDMAIVGYDNIQGFMPIPVPLCSIGYSIPDMARSGIDLLRQRIHQEDIPPQHIVYQPHLVCRGSCGTQNIPVPSGEVPDIYAYCR